MNQKWFVIGLVVVLFATAFAYMVGGSRQEQPRAGSVSVSNEYYATTTGAIAAYGGFTGDGLIKSGYGALGSVVITGANTGLVNLYDATTTDVTKRTGNRPTTTIDLVSIPASTAAGTYTYDVSFSDGLYLELVMGTMPTTTITYR